MRHLIGLAARHRGGLVDVVRAPRGARGLVRRGAARRTRLDVERVTNEPFDLRYRPRYALVIDRLGWWYALAARVAEEGRADGRRLRAEQPVHVPGDGEAFGVLRDDATRAEGARHVVDPAQAAAGERALPDDGRALQPAVRPDDDRRAGRLSALPQAVRRRPVARRVACAKRGRAAPGLRRVGRAADARPARGRRLRRLRAQPLDRRRDDGDVVRPRQADPRPLPGATRLPAAGSGAGGGDDLEDRQRVLPLGVQLVRVDRAGEARCIRSTTRTRRRTSR